MAKNKRPKYLDKETPELLEMLNEILTSDDPDTDKAAKVAAELKTRMAAKTVDNVDDALQEAAGMMTKALEMVKSAYDAEVAMITGDSDEDEGDEDEDTTPTPKTKKSRKKAEPEPEEDGDDGDDEDDEDDEDGYDGWSQKALKAEMRKRGIRVKKGMSKDDMVKALEADDDE